MAGKNNMGIKEHWLDEDKRCPNCNQVTEKVRGLNKQNLKRLLIPRMDVTELLITFLMIMLIAMSFLYKSETQVCRDWLSELTETDKAGCKAVCDLKCERIEGVKANRTELNVNELNVTGLFNKSLPLT